MDHISFRSFCWFPLKILRFSSPMVFISFVDDRSFSRHLRLHSNVDHAFPVAPPSSFVSPPLLRLRRVHFYFSPLNSILYHVSLFSCVCAPICLCVFPSNSRFHFFSLLLRRDFIVFFFSFLRQGSFIIFY